MALTVPLPDAGATERLGQLIGRRAPPGTLLRLRGPLGAGKTSLVQAVARGLGIPDDAGVRSPSFALMRVHEQGRLPLVHVDLYRLVDVDELVDLGLEDWFDGDALVAVEWVDRFPDAFAEFGLEIELCYREGDGQGRDAVLAADGDHAAALLEEIEAVLMEEGTLGG